MTFLPIVERELRVAARKPVTYRLRFFAALGVTLFWLLVVFGQRGAPPAALGSTLFVCLSFFAEIFCVAAGIFLTADCLSEEKREGTLGLLFLTDLKGHDVVFGKLAATSLNSVYALLAIFPVMAMSLLLGGVTAGEFWRVILVLLVTLFFSLAAGMLASALNREVRQAMGGALFLIAVPVVVLPVLSSTINYSFGPHRADFLNWACPITAFTASGDNSYSMPRGAAHFWDSLGGLLVMGLAAFILACVLLPRTWQESKPASSTDKRAEKMSRLRFGSAATRRTLRVRLLELNPYHWLAARDRLPQIIGWLLFGSMSVLWLCLFACIFIAPSPTNAEAFVPVLFITFGLHMLLKGMVAVEASRRLNDDRNSGALEALLVTPLPEQQIWRGQRRALYDHFKAPMLLVLSMNLALIWLIKVPNPLKLPPGEMKYSLLAIFIGGMLLLVFDINALGWVGMCTGLRSRKHHRAVLHALAQILLPPWVVLFLLALTGGLGPTGPGAFTLVWFGAGLLTDFVAGFSAREELTARFRHHAANVESGAVAVFPAGKIGAEGAEEAEV